MKKVTYEGSCVCIGETQIQLPYKILELHRYERLLSDDVLVILMDPDDFMNNSRFNNLVAYNMAGEKKWDAEFPHRQLAYDEELRKKLYAGQELPEETLPDYYYAISSVKPLKAQTFTSYECEIDLATGKIIDFYFYK